MQQDAHSLKHQRLQCSFETIQCVDAGACVATGNLFQIWKPATANARRLSLSLAMYMWYRSQFKRNLQANKLVMQQKLCQIASSLRVFSQITPVLFVYVDLAQTMIRSFSFQTQHQRRVMPAVHLVGSCILPWVEIPIGRTRQRQHNGNVLKLVLLTSHVLPLNGVTVRNAGCISRILNVAGIETLLCLKSSHDVIQN